MVGQNLRFRSLGTKLALATVGVLCVVSTLLFFELTSRERQHLVSSKIRAANMVSDLFAASLSAPLDFGDAESVEAEVRKLKRNSEIVYASVWSTTSPRPVSELRPSPTGSGPARATSDSTRVFDDRVELERLVVSTNGIVVGSTLLVFSLAAENAGFHASRVRIFWWSLAMTAATAMILIAIARHQIIAPLAKVADGARRLERGELTARLDLRSNDEIGRLAQAFNSMGAAIADREHSLQAARKSLRDLFDHMRQAIFAFGPAGLVEGEVSRQAVRLFKESELVGKNVRDVLYPNAAPHDIDAQAFEEWIVAAFSVSEAEWGEVASLGPAEIVLNADTARPIPVELEFRPVVQDGEIKRIMLLATDVSETRELERTVQSQEEVHARQMAAMRRLVAGGAQVFVSFIEGARQRLTRCAEIVGPRVRMLPSGEIDELFRHVHTIKGEAKAFDLRDLEVETAKLEQELDELRARARGDGFATTGSVHAALISRIAQAREAIEQGCEVFVAASPTGRAALDQVTVQRSDVLELLSLVGTRSDAMGRVAARLASRPFGESAANLADMAPTWADSEGKRARVQVDGREIPLPPTLARVMGGALAHLVRNAVVHGIETAEARESAGKFPVGLIHLSASFGEHGPTIAVEDDGAGLDLRQIAEKATELGEAIDGRASGELAFLPGLSTLNKAGDLGGRGVGLGAVRAELEEVGYSIDVTSEPGRFTRFLMYPKQSGASSALRYTETDVGGAMER